MGYTQYTAASTISATTEGTANTIVAASAITFDGTAVVIDFFAPYCDPQPNAAGNQANVFLYEDGVSIGRLAVISMAAPASAEILNPVRLSRRMTPSAGSHTYSIRASRTNANADFGGGAGGLGAYMPGYIRITKA